MISLAMTGVSAGVVLYIAYNVVSQYLAATGTVWERLRAAGRGSATIVWQKLGLLCAFLTTLADQGLNLIATLINDQSFADQAKAAVTSYLTPTNVAIGMAAFMAITVWARTRSLKG